LNLGDLVEHWTLVGAERDLVVVKHRDTQLGFALLLKFYGRFGRFPRGRGELHQDAVEFVARQLGVQSTSLGSYEWSGRTIRRHRGEIRVFLGFRECTVSDADKLTDWLAGDYAQKERRYELVKDTLLAECRSRSIEAPAPDRVDRIVRSGLHQAERLGHGRRGRRAGGGHRAGQVVPGRDRARVTCSRSGPGRRAHAVVADQLRIDPGAPVQDIWRTTRDLAGRTVEALHTTAP
jgi:hypothetical protein